MKLAFSTIGCPKWSFEQILANAAAMGYDGVEFHNHEVERLRSSGSAFSPENLSESRRCLQQAGLSVTAVDTPCRLDCNDWQETHREVCSYMELARGFDCPYVRLFGDRHFASREETIRVYSARLRMLAETGLSFGVMPLWETHGECAHSDLMYEVMIHVDHPNAGILWDINHPYRLNDEQMAFTAGALGHIIRYIHIKDTCRDNLPRLPGKGSLPIVNAVKALNVLGYDGWFCFEWEKLNHPYLEEPEIAFPAFMQYMKDIRGRIGRIF
jgi:sugar phosphate isomerase/epimerase